MWHCVIAAVILGLKLCDKAGVILNRVVEKVIRIKRANHANQLISRSKMGSCLSVTLDDTHNKAGRKRKCDPPVNSATSTQNKQHRRCSRCPVMADWVADWQGHTGFGWVCWASLNLALTGRKVRDARACSRAPHTSLRGFLSHSITCTQSLPDTNKQRHTHTLQSTRAKRPPWLNWFI